ncbi:MAG: hypothetical protein Ct9H90mP13_03300 [Pseudomonadota bacterium]|nr:MAG: hypothetical protein Ct9H90mP13_03300 [Pseudomonadota bacterium]
MAPTALVSVLSIFYVKNGVVGEKSNRVNTDLLVMPLTRGQEDVKRV